MRRQKNNSWRNTGRSTCIQADNFNDYLYAFDSNRGKPVVITDALDDWPAMKKWSLEFFKKELGSITTDVRLNTSTKEYRQGNTYLNSKMRV